MRISTCIKIIVIQNIEFYHPLCQIFVKNTMSKLVNVSPQYPCNSVIDTNWAFLTNFPLTRGRPKATSLRALQTFTKPFCFPLFTFHLSMAQRRLSEASPMKLDAGVSIMRMGAGGGDRGRLRRVTR
jgi:hypothetical protein